MRRDEEYGVVIAISNTDFNAIKVEGPTPGLSGSRSAKWSGWTPGSEHQPAAREPRHRLQGHPRPVGRELVRGP